MDYTGFAAGTVTHAGGGGVSIQCYVKVTFAAVPGGSTPTAIGIGTATTAGAITFAATETSYVQICTRLTTEHGLVDECFETTFQSDPAGLLTGFVCEITRFIGERGFNILGQLVIEDDGDVLVAGITVLDCVNPFELPAGVRYG